MNEAEKRQVISLLSKDTRLDGRKHLEYRKISVEPGVLTKAEGSARVKIGETEVLAGVKMEIMKPYPDTADQGSLMVNVELYPMSNPDFESGPPSLQAIELARVTDRAIRESKSIDVKKLCITAGEKAWMIIIDICTINDAGNLFDAVALAAVAAIQNAKFPAVEDDVINYKKLTDESLPLCETPMSATVYKFGDHFLVDPNYEEGKVYDSRISIGFRKDGNICSMQKGGDGTFSLEDLSKMIDIAKEASEKMRKALG